MKLSNYVSPYKMGDLMEIIDKPILNRQYLKSLIEYVTELHKIGILDKSQFSTIITNICSNYIENEVSMRLEEKLGQNFYKYLYKIKLPL